MYVLSISHYCALIIERILGVRLTFSNLILPWMRHLFGNNIEFVSVTTVIHSRIIFQL